MAKIAASKKQNKLRKIALTKLHGVKLKGAGFELQEANTFQTDKMLKKNGQNLTLKYRPINADHAEVQNGGRTKHDVQAEPNIADKNSWEE